MSTNQNLFFVAIVLPPTLQSEVREIQSYIAQKYKSSRALKVVPHITLKAPFLISEDRTGEVFRWFNNLTFTVSVFNLHLAGYGCFPNKRHPVLYVKPVGNHQLFELQSQVVEQFQKSFPEIEIMSLEKHFSPHLTVAYRDLSPEYFKIAWEEFKVKSFFTKFDVMNISLLNHKGAEWEVIETHYLKDNR